MHFPVYQKKGRGLRRGGALYAASAASRTDGSLRCSGVAANERVLFVNSTIPGIDGSSTGSGAAGAFGSSVVAGAAGASGVSGGLGMLGGIRRRGVLVWLGPLLSLGRVCLLRGC